MNGQSEITSKFVTINVKSVNMKAFMLESNLNLEPQAVNLNEVWPSLDKKLAKEIKRNLTGGQIDIMIGLHELYGKITDTTIIQHPYRRLILIKNIFCFSLGGSTLEKENPGHANDICALMSKFEATYEKDEPTLQLEVSEPNQQPEVKIQKSMDNMFHQEGENLEDGVQEKSENEDYAEQLFYKHFVLEDIGRNHCLKKISNQC